MLNLNDATLILSEKLAHLGDEELEPVSASYRDPTLNALKYEAELERHWDAVIIGDQVKKMSCDEVLSYDAEVFIRIAYERILERPPELEALINYNCKLASGFPKEYLLLELNLSDEGRRQINKLPGIKFAVVAKLLFGLPIIGWIFEYGNALLKLPRTRRAFLRAEARLNTELTMLKVQNLQDRGQRSVE